MLKNIFLVLIMIGIIGAGLGYAILQDGDRNAQLLVSQALKETAKIAPQLEQEFQTTSQLNRRQTETQLVVESSEVPVDIKLTTQVAENRITLIFGESDTELANKTIVLIPSIISNQVRWQCLQGSVLLRLRPKSCRLGEKINLADF